MTMPQNPGFPYLPGQMPGVPMQAPPQAPAPMLPQAPVFVPNVPPQVPPQTYAQPNPYAGADAAPTIVRTPNIPLGTHILRVVKYERANTASGEFAFITFRVEDSDNVSVKNTECAFKQNMRPATQGGQMIAFSALKGALFPIWGYSLTEPSHKAAIDALCAAGKFSAWLLELETRGTVEGKPVVGRTVHCMCQPGVRTPKTQPGKEPFPRMVFSPNEAPIA